MWASVFLAKEEAKGDGILQTAVAAGLSLWSAVASVLEVIPSSRLEFLSSNCSAWCLVEAIARAAHA